MLKGKNAVVTGSTSGIGLGIARAMAGAGANVMLNGFGDAAEIERHRTEIANEFKVKALYSPADMTKPAEIAAMIKTAEAAFGAVDVLVNNAGIQHVAPIEEFPLDKWDAVLAINLMSAFHTIRAAVPGMKARQWGRIINTASAHSLVASPFKAAYVTAKHGLIGLSKTVALELATFGVTCNCISPGYVWTPLVEKQIPDQMKTRNMTEEQVKRDVLLAAQPTKQFVTVDQVAASRSISPPTPPRTSPAPTFRSTAAGRRSDPAFFQSVRQAQARPAPSRAQAHQSRTAGRRRARRLHLGRARPSARGRSADDRRHLRRVGRRGQRGDAG